MSETRDGITLSQGAHAWSARSATAPRQVSIAGDAYLALVWLAKALDEAAEKARFAAVAERHRAQAQAARAWAEELR